MKNLLLMTLLLYSQIGLSCRGPSPFKDKSKAEADIILKARATKYTSISENKALLHFDIVKKIKGEVPKNSALLTSNTDTSIPKTLKNFTQCYGKVFELGLVKGSKTLKILKEVCGQPYILPSNKKRPKVCVFN